MRALASSRAPHQRYAQSKFIGSDNYPKNFYELEGARSRWARAYH